MELEHPLITSLYNAFVLQGDFSSTEQILVSMGSVSLFTMSLLDVQPLMHWTRLQDDEVPSARGGHATCIDPQNGQVYMFGGWDGQKNLDDFWAFDIATGKWRLLMAATENDPHGPGPRACHKMVFDTNTGAIYVFGKLEEPNNVEIEVPSSSPHGSGLQAPTASPVDLRAPPLPINAPTRTMSWINYPAELFRYHSRGSQAGRWELVSADTAVSATRQSFRVTDSLSLFTGRGRTTASIRPSDVSGYRRADHVHLWRARCRWRMGDPEILRNIQLRHQIEKVEGHPVSFQTYCEYSLLSRLHLRASDVSTSYPLIPARFGK